MGHGVPGPPAQLLAWMISKTFRTKGELEPAIQTVPLVSSKTDHAWYLCANLVKLMMNMPNPFFKLLFFRMSKIFCLEFRKGSN